MVQREMVRPETVKAKSVRPGTMQPDRVHRRAAILLALAVTGVAVLSGCAADAGSGGVADPALHGAWVVQSARDAKGFLDLSYSTITLTVGQSIRTTGRTTCGPYAAEILGSLSGLHVDVAASTPTGCATGKQTTIQDRYLRALAAARNAVLDRGTLELSAPGVALQFVPAATVSLASIGAHGWSLSGIDRNPGSDGYTWTPTSGTFQLDGANRFSGTTGCLKFTGSYEIDAGQFIVTNGETSGVPCGQTEVHVDADVLGVLHGAFNVKPQSGTLEVTNEQLGVSLLYLASPLKRAVP
jgi:heat shock protein HslJ